MGLRENEIHIWQADLRPMAADLPLSRAELCKAERFRFERDRRTYRMARATLRWLLAHYLGVPAVDIEIVEGTHGKPALAGPAAVEFNLSHSGELALIAVSRRPVGIDLERVDPHLDWQLLAEAGCHPLEQAYIGAGESAGAIMRFYEVWTRKEAYLKAIGVGLMQPPESICTLPGSSPPGWHLHCHPAIPGYTAAVATPLARPAWVYRPFCLQSVPGGTRLPS